MLEQHADEALDEQLKCNFSHFSHAYACMHALFNFWAAHFDLDPPTTAKYDLDLISRSGCLGGRRGGG